MQRSLFILILLGELSDLHYFGIYRPVPVTLSGFGDNLVNNLFATILVK